METSNNEMLFDKFELNKCYKKDEHSAVYLAKHIYLDKQVFLKILNTKTIPDPNIIERFKREAKILAKLEHDNIIKVFDFGMSKEYFYISFEYFESENLRELLSGKNLNNDTKKDILIQLLKGLECVHNNKILHRDIKPENILVGKGNHVKITDFGLAQISLDSLITQKYSVIGTPAYMSPEQVHGDPLSIQSDLFSLGITLLEMYTGKNLFIGNDTNETINNIISYDEHNFYELFKELPEDVSEIIKDLLVSDPSKRTGSTTEILNRLGIENVQPNLREDKSKLALILPILIIFISIITFWLYFHFSEDETATKVTSDELTNEIVNETSYPDTSMSSENISENTPPVESSDNQNDQIGKNEEIIEQDEKLGENELIDDNMMDGQLFVKCYPWAEVQIDNKYFETTPFPGNINLSPGEYLITLIHPDYPEYKDSVIINSASLSLVEVNFDSLFGYLNCQLYPWGEVYINDEKIGITPLKSPIPLNPGNYVVMLRNPNYENYEKNIEIVRNDTININYNFASGDNN